MTPEQDIKRALRARGGGMTVSAMAQMSRAIREQIQQHGQTLRDLPDDVLRDYVDIVGAFYGDLRAEWERRQ